MRWSWNLGRIAGTEIRIHVTFALFLLLIAAATLLRGQGVATALLGLAFMAAIFATVLLHEFGHALMGRRFGVRTLDITLLPIGGIARVERLPERPIQELLVAFAGPAVNIALAAGIFGSLALARQPLLPDPAHPGSVFLVQLAWVNLFLAAFNLLPAFPMDGGRVLRASLSVKLGRARATWMAARIGQAMAVVFGVFGLLFNPLLVFIAIFVWAGAASESEETRVQSEISGIAVQRVMVTDFHSLSPEDPLSVPKALLRHSFQQDFPVAREGVYEGLLTHRALIDGLSRSGEGMRVSDAMRLELPVLDPAEQLSSALAKLRDSGEGALPVLRGSQVVGLLTKEKLGEFLAPRPAWRHA